MIEINLVPDVKQELIRAKRIRTLVISSAIIAAIVAIGIVVLMSIYLFGVQQFRSSAADGVIHDKSTELANVDDLENTLTIQHQLSKIDELHSKTNINSRFFDLLVAINPPAPNNVSFSLARIDIDKGIVRLEGQAENGYAAADVLKKTILNTSVNYRDEKNETKTALLTDQVVTVELSYGENSLGTKVLRFAFEFEYDDAFFARSSKNAVILKPNRQVVTDSYQRLPKSLFSGNVTSSKETE